MMNRHFIFALCTVLGFSVSGISMAQSVPTDKEAAAKAAKAYAIAQLGAAQANARLARDTQANLIRQAGLNDAGEAERLAAANFFSAAYSAVHQANIEAQHYIDFSAAYSAVHHPVNELTELVLFSAAYSAVHSLMAGSDSSSAFSAAYSAVHDAGRTPGLDRIFSAAYSAVHG